MKGVALVKFVRLERTGGKPAIHLNPLHVVAVYERRGETILRLQGNQEDSEIVSGAADAVAMRLSEALRIPWWRALGLHI